LHFDIAKRCGTSQGSKEKKEKVPIDREAECSLHAEAVPLHGRRLVDAREFSYPRNIRVQPYEAIAFGDRFVLLLVIGERRSNR
jgi:hypothetical protein